MNWPKPILTDSGGFQVMSLAARRKIDAEGVTFRSHIDGREHRLTPARSIGIQELLGADVTMAFDDCTPFPADHRTDAESMRPSLRSAEGYRAAYRDRPGHPLPGTVQGRVIPDPRRPS